MFSKMCIQRVIIIVKDFLLQYLLNPLLSYKYLMAYSISMLQVSPHCGISMDSCFEPIKEVLFKSCSAILVSF